MYSSRNLEVIPLFDDNFIGLDGISQNIYNKEGWIKALHVDYKQINYPFDISIVDFEKRETENGLLIIAVITFWDLPFFKDFPEIDKMRTVFILQPHQASFRIVHISNSIGLVTVNRTDVYPKGLIEILRSFR
ncbi:hypothetical protein [Winogradskyella sediminis]|uniref:hypothetical protein n=1 Tax=Winogradskyella sediminis TaxID=1382466 RepID=UPI0011C0286C|nr:hypothetical protein [Winogradskyella sediminis]